MGYFFGPVPSQSTLVAFPAVAIWLRRRMRMHLAFGAAAGLVIVGALVDFASYLLHDPAHGHVSELWLALAFEIVTLIPPFLAITVMTMKCDAARLERRSDIVRFYIAMFLLQFGVYLLCISPALRLLDFLAHHSA